MTLQGLYINNNIVIIVITIIDTSNNDKIITIDKNNRCILRFQVEEKNLPIRSDKTINTCVFSDSG